MLKSAQSNVYLWNSFAHLEQNNSKMNEVIVNIIILGQESISYCY